MKCALLCAAIVMICGSIACSSQGTTDTPKHTGVDLLGECQLVFNETTGTEQKYKSAHCLGYVSGITDALFLWKGVNSHFKRNLPAPACLPESATLEEYIRVVVKYLNDHPNRLHESYRQLSIAALSDAYPCKL